MIEYWTLSSRFSLVATVILGVTPACGPMSSNDEVSSTEAALSTVASAVRGYTRNDNTEGIVYRRPSWDGGGIAELSGNFPNYTLTNVASSSISAPWAYRRADGGNAVVYVNPVQHVIEVRQFFNPPSWPFTNLSMGNGAPLVKIGSDPVAYVRTDNRNAVVYRSVDDHLIELAHNPAGSPLWVVSDLTAVSTPSGQLRR